MITAGSLNTAAQTLTTVMGPNSEKSTMIDTGGPAGMYASWTSQLPLQLLLGPGLM